MLGVRVWRMEQTSQRKTRGLNASIRTLMTGTFDQLNVQDRTVSTIKHRHVFFVIVSSRRPEFLLDAPTAHQMPGWIPPCSHPKAPQFLIRLLSFHTTLQLAFLPLRSPQSTILLPQTHILHHPSSPPPQPKKHPFLPSPPPQQ